MCPSTATVTAFSFHLAFYAATDGDCRCDRSTVTPIAQMKPKSSRPTAVTTYC